MAVITRVKAGSLSLSRDLARVTTPVTSSMAIVKSEMGHKMIKLLLGSRKVAIIMGI